MQLNSPPLGELALPGVATSPARARELIAVLLGPRIGPDAVAMTELLVSELVTNVVLHARTDAVLRLHLVPGGHLVRVEVFDASPAVPAMRRYARDAMTGRGLHLVDLLSSRWGVDRAEVGKCVWFELDTQTLHSAEQAMVFDLDTVEAL